MLLTDLYDEARMSFVQLGIIVQLGMGRGGKKVHEMTRWKIRGG